MKLILSSILALFLFVPAPAGAQQETLLLQIIQDVQNPRRPVRPEPLQSSSDPQNYEADDVEADAKEAPPVPEGAENYEAPPAQVNPGMK